MTGDDILRLASELFASSKPKSEALCRAIVGRSYYAAYHLALALFADLGLPRSSDHKAAQRWLIESGHSNAKEAGRQLDSLYGARRRADYDLHSACGKAALCLIKEFLIDSGRDHRSHR